jgi:thiamine-phosphate pyrophosphorylase
VTLCLVTSRRRFNPPVEGLLAQLRRAVEASVDLVQIRERDLEAAALTSLVASALTIARGTRTRIIVNDRLDVALACGADGVHLRSDSFGVADARRLAPAGFLIGRSVHSAEEARLAADADYLIAGAVFPTPSKSAGTAWLGADGLRAIVRATDAPVLAIGGVTLDRVGEVAATGAAGVAAIALFDTTLLTECAVEARRRFDSVRTAP